MGMPGQARADLVVNGNFATGDFTGWDLPGDTSGFYVSGIPGSFAAALTTSSETTDGFLNQTLATLAGQSYTVSFELAGDGAAPNSITASLGGTTLVSLTNVPDTLPSFTTYTYQYTATSTSSTLSFDVLDAPGYLYVTDVSVIANASAVPEPASVFLVGIGSMFVGAHRWRTSRKAAKA